jgi:trehalose/maltose transport system permease protein
MALLLLSGLQTIPGSLAEAARIDGASEWQYFWRIRLPLLAPTLLIAALFRAPDAFRIFDLVYVLTGGGPADATEVLSTLTYKTLFLLCSSARDPLLPAPSSLPKCSSPSVLALLSREK